VNMNASRIIFSIFLYGFSLLVILYFFVLVTIFYKSVFFKSDQAYREAMDGGARDSNLRSF